MVNIRYMDMMRHMIMSINRLTPLTEHLTEHHEGHTPSTSTTYSYYTLLLVLCGGRCPLGSTQQAWKRIGGPARAKPGGGKQPPAPAWRGPRAAQAAAPRPALQGVRSHARGPFEWACDERVASCVLVEKHCGAVGCPSCVGLADGGSDPSCPLAAPSLHLAVPGQAQLELGALRSLGACRCGGWL